MLRIEYIEIYGCYRVYNTNEPNRTVAYESDYNEAIKRIREIDNRPF